MQIQTSYITKNDCYKAGRTITPKGIMVHATATPGVMAADWYSRWNKPGIETAVHAFVDDSAVCQHLPWNHRAWHCAAAANNTHIAFELCEPTRWKTDAVYFSACCENAVALAAYLCQKYHLTEKDIISHKEGYLQGIASNHGDPDHWWSYFGYTMDRFRADVKKKLAGRQVTVTTGAVKRPTLQSGCVGESVTALQKRLNFMRIALDLAYNTLDEDGIFGAKTREAVRAFQTARSLTADGIVGEKTWAALSVSYGDVNGDGKRNAADALQVLQAAVGKTTLTASQKKAADMNADGTVNAADAQKILRQAVNRS